MMNQSLLADEPEANQSAYVQLSPHHDSADAKHEHHHSGHHLTPEEQEIMKKFESLDYDIVENSLHDKRENFLRNNTWEKRKETLQGWVVYFLIGFSTGTCAFLVAITVEALSDLRFEAAEKLVEKNELVPAYIVFVLFAVVYIAIAAFLVSFVEPASGGSGIPELKGYLNGSKIPNLLTMKTLVCKMIGVSFAISGGLTCGKEGPLVHVGSVFAAFFSHAPMLATWCNEDRFRRYRNDHDKRDFVSAGAAAGVAAAFGAPIGGVLFSLEEASSFWSLPLTWRVFFSAIVSTFTLNILKTAYDGNPMEVNNPGLITFGKFVESAYRLWELPFFLLLAIIGGLLGALFNEINVKINHWRRDRKIAHPRANPKIRFIEALVIAALTATVFFWAPAIVKYCRDDLDDNVSSCVSFVDSPGTCVVSEDYYCPGEIDSHLDQCQKNEDEEYAQYTCDEGKHNLLATLTFQTQEKAIKSFFHNIADFGNTTLIIFFLLYFTLAVMTYGIAVPSGLFVPGILCGCAYGRLLGELLKKSFSDIHPGVYAMLGATSMLGGCTRMTISLTVILLETTNDIQYLLPIMMVLMVSKWVGDFFNISLYDMHVELKCIPFVESAPPRQMQGIPVRNVMSKDVITVDAVSKCSDIIDILTDQAHKHNGFPVVKKDDNGDKRLVGMILRSQLCTLLEKKAMITEDYAKIAMTEPELDPVRAQEREIGHEDLIVRPHGFLKQSDFGSELDHTDSVQVRIPNLPSLAGSSESFESLWMDIRPYMNPAPFSVSDSTPIARVYRLFRSMGIRHLPVVDKNNIVRGILTRKELRTDFKQDLF